MRRVAPPREAYTICERIELFIGKKKVMSRSIIRRWTPFLTARIRENQRLLSSSSASVLHHASPSSSSSPSPEPVLMTQNCIRVCPSSIHNIYIHTPFLYRFIFVFDCQVFNFYTPLCLLTECNHFHMFASRKIQFK